MANFKERQGKRARGRRRAAGGEVGVETATTAPGGSRPGINRLGLEMTRGRRSNVVIANYVDPWLVHFMRKQTDIAQSMKCLIKNYLNYSLDITNIYAVESANIISQYRTNSAQTELTDLFQYRIRRRILLSRQITGGRSMTTPRTIAQISCRSVESKDRPSAGRGCVSR